MSNHLRHLRGAALGFALFSAGAAPSLAQSAADVATAESLFAAGREAMAQGRTAEACPKFEESQRLDPASGTLLNLATCYEKLGRTASAWSTYLAAADSARASNNPKRAEAARKSAKALEPRLSRLAIKVETGARVPGLRVERDGQAVGEAQWGDAIAIDPGEYVISASAPGREEWRKPVVVNREGATVEVVVPELTPKAAASAEAASVGAGAAPEQPKDGGALPEREGSDRGSTQRTLGWITTGVGVVGVGVGIAFGLISKGHHDDSEQYCDGGACTDQKGIDALDSARSAGDLSTIAFIVGGVGLGGGLTLLLSAPSADQNSGGAYPRVARVEWRSQW